MRKVNQMGVVRTFPVAACFSLTLLLPTMYVYLYHVRKPSIKPFDARLLKSEVSIATDVLPENYRPKILIWAKQYHAIGWTFPDLPGEGGCDVTFDRAEYSSSDAVVFYMKSCNSNDLPQQNTRSPHQAFVWWAHESPWTVLYYYAHDLKDFNNYFNWTMTYRRDADVLASFAPTPTMDYFLHKFGRLSEMKDKKLTSQLPMSKETFHEETSALLLKKTKFIAWVASDCDLTRGASKRVQIVAEMKEKGSLQIDKFGKCGDAEIEQNYSVLFETLSPYKFYLAFENSYHCRDYITEKTFYNSLVSSAVPVIHGPTKDDALTILPKGSFIHVEDYENITSLANYLDYLNKNDSAYLEYFRWWRHPGSKAYPRYGFNYGSENQNTSKMWESAIQNDMMEIERFGLYHLCRKLRNMDHLKTSKVIPDLNKLWFGSESGECMQK